MTDNNLNPMQTNVALFPKEEIVEMTCESKPLIDGYVYLSKSGSKSKAVDEFDTSQSETIRVSGTNSSPFPDQVPVSLPTNEACGFSSHVAHRIEKIDQDTEIRSAISDGSNQKIKDPNFHLNTGLVMQPSPEQPKGTYVRRRAFSDHLKQSWAQKFKMFRFIPCSLGNCKFLAMSVEDMALHYGLCLGDEKFADYVCPYCGGRLTSEAVLNIHIARSHVKMGHEITPAEGEERDPKVVSKMSKMITTWRQNLDQNGFIMCTKCSLISFTVEEQCLHFGQCRGVTSRVNFICTYCSGYTKNQSDLDRHVLSSHKNKELIFKKRGPAILHYKNKGKTKSKTSDGSQSIEDERKYGEVEPKLYADFINSHEGSKTVCKVEIHDIVQENIASLNQNSVPDCPGQAETYVTDQEPYVDQTMPNAPLEETTTKLPGEETLIENGNAEVVSVVNAPTKEKITNKVKSKRQDSDGEPPRKKPLVVVSSDGSDSEDFVSRINTRNRKKVSKKSSAERSKQLKNSPKRKKKSESSDEQPVGQSKGKKKTQVKNKKINQEPINMIECGKCHLKVASKTWQLHNAKEHAGLGWVEGETPINIHALDKHEVFVMVRNAFKFTNQAVCELCKVKKKSFIGFHSHIMICGKSEEEIEQSLATCSVCGKGVLPVSLKSHMKMHQNDGKPDKNENLERTTKRKSAIRAITHLQQSLKADSSNYALFKKGDEHIDISFYNPKILNCPRPDCNKELTKVASVAVEHILNCPTLPNEYYQCLSCPRFFLTESEVANHVCDDNKGDADDYQKGADEEFTDEEEISDDGEFNNPDGPRVPRKIVFTVAKHRFIQRNKLIRRLNGEFYNTAFELELSSQREILKKLEPYPEFHTEPHDWILVPTAKLNSFMPPLSQSLRVNYNGGSFEKLNVFKTSNIDNCNAFFVGGSVQNLAWCPLNLNCDSSTHQLLAISASSEMDYYPSILTNKTKTALLQIWDVGDLAPDGEDKPRFRLGIALEFGELWDMTWSPFDARAAKNGNQLERLGVIAMAFNDGIVRIYSIANLETQNKRLPIYKTQPIAMLKTHSFENETQEKSCLRVSWGQGGVICGGFRSGLISVWNLNLHSKRITSKTQKSFSLYPYRVFYAHIGPVTALTLCPNDSAFLITNGGDRKIKHWDLRSRLSVPTRQAGSVVFQNLYWMRNWPATYYLEFDGDLALDTPPNIRLETFPRLKSPSAIKGLSFSEWLCCTAISNESGEIVLRYITDPLNDRYRKSPAKTGLTHIAYKCNLTSKEIFSSYSDIEDSGNGISFVDLKNRDCVKMSNPPHSVAYSVTIPEKLAFNPNYRRFNHLAAGYRSGIMRILRLDYFQSSIDEHVAAAKIS